MDKWMKNVDIALSPLHINWKILEESREGGEEGRTCCGYEFKGITWVCGVRLSYCTLQSPGSNWAKGSTTQLASGRERAEVWPPTWLATSKWQPCLQQTGHLTVSYIHVSYCYHLIKAVICVAHCHFIQGCAKMSPLVKCFSWVHIKGNSPSLL